MKIFTRTLAAGFAATPLLAGTAWAQAGERYYYGHHGMMGGWFGGVVMMLLMLALIVGAVVLTLRLLGHGPAGRSSGRALDILNERFARGEIDRAEYEDRRRALQDGESR
jgi:putative membrane protein